MALVDPMGQYAVGIVQPCTITDKAPVPMGQAKPGTHAKKKKSQ